MSLIVNSLSFIVILPILCLLSCTMYQSLQKIFRFLFSLYALILFLVAIVLMLPILLLLPLMSVKKRGDVLFVILRIFISIFFRLTGIRPKIVSDDHQEDNSSLVFIFNHISYLDALVAVHALRGRSVRGLGKYEFSKIPLIGSIYKNAVILVKRGDKEDRARSIAAMKDTINRGTSIFLAPEGTFNESSNPLSTFYDGAFRIAIETRTPLKPMLLLDTYDRMNYRSVFSFNPGRSRVVFLQTFSVDEYSIDDLPLFKEKVFKHMQDELIKHQASWIKTDD